MIRKYFQLAGQYDSAFPHTHLAMQNLIMAMEGYASKRGKRGWLGDDKGLKAYKKFEEKFRDILLALELDKEICRSDNSDEIRDKVVHHIVAFAEIYPNWPKAYSFAEEYFLNNANQAVSVIENLYK